MAKQNYPVFCNIDIAVGAMDQVNIKLIKSAYTVYVGVDSSGSYYHFTKNRIIKDKIIVADESQMEACCAGGRG